MLTQKALVPFFIQAPGGTPSAMIQALIVCISMAQTILQGELDQMKE